MHQIVKAGFVIGMAGFMATSAMAQNVVKQFPSGLKWETMDLIGFNYNYPGFEGTPNERKIADAIWGSTIAGFPIRDGGQRWSAAIIQVTLENNAQRFIFTSLDSASVVYPECEDAINSKDPNTPIYTICPIRIIKQDKKTGQSTQAKYSGFCHIASNDGDQPKSRNYAQVAVSPDGKTGYYRVVQYGKPAPECNRAFKLP